MKNLSQISALVTNISSGSKLIIDDDSNSKLNKLLRGLVNGDYKKDMDAAHSLYHTSPKSKSYLMLKSRLKERLLDKFFLIDSDKAMKSRYGKALYQCLRNVFAAQVMVMRDMRKNAAELLRGTISQAQQFYFTDISLEIFRFLRFDASQNGEKEKWIHYDKMVRHYLKLQEAELLADKYAQLIVVEFARKSPSQKQILGKAHSSYRKICELSSKHESYAIEMNKFKTGARYYTIANEHGKAIAVCNQCEKYLHDNPHLLQPIRLAEMALFKMDNCISMRDASNGLRYALQCEKYFNRDHINWLIFREYDFLLCMHTGNYSRALQIFYEITGHQRFNQQNPERLEKWKIFEAYLNYALPSQLPKKNFNLFKFLNEITIYSKDKKGYNFAILIAEILLLIETGESEKLINIYDSFQMYVKRHVSRKNNLRSYYFAKLILVLFKYNFEPVKSDRIGKKFYDRINKITPDYNGNLESMEVIPYDILWELILRKLRK